MVKDHIFALFNFGTLPLLTRLNCLKAMINLLNLNSFQVGQIYMCRKYMFQVQLQKYNTCSFTACKNNLQLKEI